MNNYKLCLEDVAKEQSQRHLNSFIKHFWKVIDPAEYIHNWHIDAICEHLEAVLSAQIKKLIINIPPRHQKSLTTAVFFPAWAWIAKPETQWLFASYAHSLSIRDSNKCRTVILSSQYQQWFGDKFKLSDSQNTKNKFANNYNGFRLATSVGGSNTGEGADIIIYDDPNNMNEIMSAARRSGVNEWHDTVMSTRLNNPNAGRRIMIQQRGHEQDLTGHILKKENDWELLILPARYERKTYSFTSLNFTDPREAEGELLWKEQFNEKAIENLEMSLGSYGTAGQLQQRPAPVGGGMIKIAAFKRYKMLPERFDRIINSWDTAQKTGILNDFTVCTTWGCLNNNYYLLSVFRKKIEYPELKKSCIILNSLYNANLNLIEDKSSGSSLIQDVKRDIPVKAVTPHGDKLTRMYVEYARIEGGFVHLPESAAWMSDLENELLCFPNGEHDDQVDSMSQFLAYMRTEKKWSMPSQYQRGR